MEMQQMMEMLARMNASMKTHQEEMRANRDKADADSKAWREEMAAWGEKLDAETKATQARTRAIEARTEAMREIMGTSHIGLVCAFKPERDVKRDGGTSRRRKAGPSGHET